MKHQGTQVLQTNRLILRRFSMDDASAMYKNWASDEKVTKYMTWSAHKELKETKEIVALWVDSYKKDDFYLWCIQLKESKKIIGSISSVMINEQTNSVEIGYCIGYDYWNQGYTSEALKEIMRYFFENIQVKTIRAQHALENIASGKVMQKCKMKYEGTLKNAGITSKGIICDMVSYSAIKEEWR